MLMFNKITEISGLDNVPSLQTLLLEHNPLDEGEVNKAEIKRLEKVGVDVKI